ncbi:OmpH family outer membrane protein [Mangrovimonas spongiae]|uniref:OmpH family outer membrane protein n=1 Tax=Mangrovimonas spongiae TaxID=2494697 RepID=A0A428K532_9FLAO|nr:OmpH family outer membrane protein [Mangrovimonas spongiae]RSK41538.1 OmpH family outer membrane protein [Mangrovimonas spongiae]
MKYTLALSVLLFTSCEQQKIGFVDNSTLINDYQEKIDIEKKFQTKIDAFQKRTDSISKAFQLEAQEFQLNAGKLSQKKAQEQYEALGKKQQMLQQKIQFEEQQIQEQSQSEIDSLINKVKDYVKSYGETHGYTYILGSNEGGSVMFGKEENDLTDTILKELNDAYKTKK